MNIYFTVTIDTECDSGPGWVHKQPIQFEAVTQSIPDCLQSVYDKHGVRATYLLSPEVIEDDSSVKVLKGLENVELGTHLHGEFIEPNRKGDVRTCQDYQGAYPRVIEEAKMKGLTGLFREKFGYAPKSFRAGRFGIGRNSLKILQDLGYLVDSSVTPYVWFARHDDCIDFRKALEQPYFPSENDYTQAGEMSILEVPITINSRLRNFYRKTGVQNRLLNYASKVPSLKPVWLRPTFSSFTQMKSVVDYYLNAYKHENSVVLNMMFHNVEVLQGRNPYTKTVDEVNSFIDRMESILIYVKQLGARFVGLSEVYEVYKSNTKLTSSV